MRRTVSGIAPAVVAVALLAMASPSAAQSGVDVRSDLTYATHGGVVLRLDAYVPPGEGPVPAVIVIPGGRWVEIDKTKHADVPMYFAEHGVAAFAIEYRSALEFPYPAAVDDVTAAIRWVRGHAAEFGVDPAQLGAIGVSSGGHLAALAATRGSGPTTQGARVRVVVSWSGLLDLAALVDSSDERVREPVRTFLGCSPAEPCAGLARGASPVTYIDPSDPPMFLVNGDDEIVPVDQPESMGQALEDAGIENRVEVVQGGHGAGYGGGTKILDRVLPYVGAWIAGDEAPAAEAPAAEAAIEEPVQEPVEPVPGGTQGQQEGKSGQVAPASPASPSAKDGSRPGDAPRAVRGGGSSVGVVAVAGAMGAIVLVVVLLFVIAQLRRRLDDLTRSAPPDGGVPHGVPMEQT